jgi:hypothetical protein
VSRRVVSTGGFKVSGTAAALSGLTGGLGGTVSAVLAVPGVPLTVRNTMHLDQVAGTVAPFLPNPDHQAVEERRLGLEGADSRRVLLRSPRTSHLSRDTDDPWCGCIRGQAPRRVARGRASAIAGRLRVESGVAAFLAESSASRRTFTMESKTC